ncbi:MAG TPA: RNA polymerase sigma factor [Herpetosiphonaceae bacterium]
MLQTERDLDVLEQQCRAAVGMLRARYGWQLLDEAEFVRRTVAFVAADGTSDPRRAATHIYCKALYAACSGAEGAERQNQGYTELFHYLYDSARRYTNDCAEVAQLAIERVFLAFPRCHEPGTFLAFAYQQLRDAARSIQRQEQQRPQSLEAPVGNGYEPLGAYLPDQRQPELSAALIVEELRDRFRQVVGTFLQAHPRASQQIAALQLKYLDGLDDQTISQHLGVPVNSVYVLRSRAIKRLQADHGWRALAVELGILPDDS